MYKILENNQIIDVLEDLKYVKCLPRTKRNILVDERQANGIMSSNGNEVYHLCGTPFTFDGPKKSVVIEEISQEEYDQLATQIKRNEDLENRVKELEKLLKELYLRIS